MVVTHKISLEDGRIESDRNPLNAVKVYVCGQFKGGCFTLFRNNCKAALVFQSKSVLFDVVIEEVAAVDSVTEFFQFFATCYQEWLIQAYIEFHLLIYNIVHGRMEFNHAAGILGKRKDCVMRYRNDISIVHLLPCHPMVGASRSKVVTYRQYVFNGVSCGIYIEIYRSGGCNGGRLVFQTFDTRVHTRGKHPVGIIAQTSFQSITQHLCRS